jgi:hypothetical protein
METAVKFLASLFVLDSGSQKIDQPFLIEGEGGIDSLEQAALTLPVADEPECPYAPAAKTVVPAQACPTMPLMTDGRPFPMLFSLDLDEGSQLKGAELW